MATKTVIEAHLIRIRFNFSISICLVGQLVGLCGERIPISPTIIGEKLVRKYFWLKKSADYPEH